jgi:hypothetical protein
VDVPGLGPLISDSLGRYVSTPVEIAALRGATCRLVFEGLDNEPEPQGYRDDEGKEHARHFSLKREAQAWLDTQTAALVSGTHVSPEQARITVGEWCDTWLAGYRGHRPSTVRQAEVGDKRLGAVRPSQVRRWCVQLVAEGLADSYVYALHARLAQLYSDAVHDGLVASRPALGVPPPGGEAEAVRRDDRSGVGSV